MEVSRRMKFSVIKNRNLRSKLFDSKVGRSINTCKSIKTNIIFLKYFFEACEFLPQNSVFAEIQMYTTVARCPEKIIDLVFSIYVLKC